MVIHLWLVIGIAITTSIFQQGANVNALHDNGDQHDRIDPNQLPETGNAQEHEELFEEQQDDNHPFPIQEEHGLLEDDNEEGHINDHHQQDNNYRFPIQEEHGPPEDNNEEGHINDHHQQDDNYRFPIQEEHGPLEDDNEEGHINDHHQQDDYYPFPIQDEHGPLEDDNEEGHINDHHQQMDLNQLPETGNPQEHAEHQFAEQNVIRHHIDLRQILAPVREEEKRIQNEKRERRKRDERLYQERFERERRSKEEYISKLNGKIEELEEKHHLLQYLNEREGQKLKEISSRIGQFKKQRMTARVNAQVASARTENLSLPSTSQEQNQQENAGQQRTANGNQNEQSLPLPLESTEESTEVHDNGREAITTDDNAVPALHTGECSINPEGTEQEKDDNKSTNVVNDKEQNDSGNQPVLGAHAIGPEAMEQNESQEK